MHSGVNSVFFYLKRVDTRCRLKLFSMPLNVWFSSAGKSPSMRTRSRLSSTTLSICSTKTGHASTHAPQVVQDQTSSASTAVPTIGFSFSSDPPFNNTGAFSFKLSNKSRISFFGDNGLSLKYAGHISWHLPQLVQASKSSKFFQEKSFIFPTPNISAFSISIVLISPRGFCDLR